MDRSEIAKAACYQNVVVMRHGDRIDLVDPSWTLTAPRAWDPHLVDEGLIRAFQTGLTFRNSLPFPLHRLFVSPFLRCIQTASQLISALNSNVMVSVEYGLCEMMSRDAISPEVAPKHGNWGFDISELEAMLPPDTVDHNVERIYKQLPQWEEPVFSTRARYQQIVKDLADKYPSENLLLVTHGECVGVTLSSFKKGASVYQVDYCGYVQLRRPIFKKDESFSAGEFQLVAGSAQTGVNYLCTGSSSNDDIN